MTRHRANVRARGYWGLVLYKPKGIANAGAIVRSAACFGASFICTVGQRYKQDAMDTAKVFRHFPGFHFDKLEDCLYALPLDCTNVRVEVDGEGKLGDFAPPVRAAYWFGGEDETVPSLPNATSVRIATITCLNLAVAAGILMYEITRPSCRSG